MKKTVSFLIILLIFNLISPYVSYAKGEGKTDYTSEQMDMNKEIKGNTSPDEEIKNQPVEEEMYEDFLVHIIKSDVEIYENINDLTHPIIAESSYVDSVYYVKSQATIDNHIYYLITTELNNDKSVVGWVESQNLSIRPFISVDEKEKKLFIKETGVAYSQPWGGNNDLVLDLTAYRNKEFKVNLTKSVGDDIWYRGNLNDETVWIQSIHLNSHDDKEGEQDKEEGKVDPKDVELDTESKGSKAESKQDNDSDFKGERKQPQENRKNDVHKEYSNDDQLANENKSETNNEVKGNEIFARSFADITVEESKTSKLGHIKNSEVEIYKEVGNSSTATKAGSKYTNSVYYIKKQAKVGSEIYYLISKEPSSAKGVVGWIKSEDLATHTHVSIDKKAKTFYVKGTGKAYDTAWGGSKNLVYNLSQYKGQAFKVHLTEKVGNNTWYRGKLNGKTVWMHSSYVTSKEESKTSKLGHIKNSKVEIYKEVGNLSTATKAGSKYTNSVYYIKKQAKVGSEIYYLISKEPSSAKGVVGWIKSEDLATHTHVNIDKKAKTFYVKGTGKAYDTAWGGSKNLVYNLSQYKGQVFKVHLTEKVGSNTWYRGKLNGKTVWIHESYLSQSSLKEVIHTYTNYDLTLNKMADIQMAVNPQTDKKYQLWIREDAFKKGSIKNGKATVSGDSWNLRRGPGTNYLTGGKVNNGTVLTLKSNVKGSDGHTWYYVRDTSGWVTPDMNDLKYYLNPLQFTGSLKDSLQFLKLSESANLNISEINGKILKGKGILAGKAQSFADGSKAYGVNEIYLISHALLETGNGTSKLATGVKYKGKTVYNMYGVGAKDSCPVECGTKYAYDAGWFTPELAIKGGAEFVGKNYLGVGQDTLYKMRWNPLFAATNGYATHQYATDIGWASKQTTRMYELYNLLNGYSMILDIPKYK